MDECAEFLKKTLGERRDFNKEKGLCFGCYSSEHIAKLCRSRRSCETCNKKHPTSLHDYNWKPEEVNTEGRNPQHKESETRKEDQVINACTLICNVTEAGDLPITMGIFPIWLYHKDKPNNRICVYALLDNASGGTFIKDDALKKLGVEGIESKILLITMHSTKNTKAVGGLMAFHFQENEVSLALPRTYVIRQIPADRDEIPRPERVQGWPHQQQISKYLPAYMDSVEVGLLIGLNCPGAVRPRDVICGNENDPYAVRSLLGWNINGPVRHKSSKQVLIAIEFRFLRAA